SMRARRTTSCTTSAVPTLTAPSCRCSRNERGTRCTRLPFTPSNPPGIHAGSAGTKTGAWILDTNGTDGNCGTDGESVPVRPLLARPRPRHAPSAEEGGPSCYSGAALSVGRTLLGSSNSEAPLPGVPKVQQGCLTLPEQQIDRAEGRSHLDGD